MIIDYRKYANIDYKKYKRIFAFGCSFTNYHNWPTWADVLSYEMADSEFYNLGTTGGGNLFITERIMAANQNYRFTDTDLIMVMWSTFSRWDIYKRNSWITPGNIFTQGQIPMSFVKEFACVKGFIVRDLALITATKHSLTHLPCDAIMLKSVDPDYDRNMYDGDDLEDVIELYRDVIYDMPATLFSFATNGKGGWINGHHYKWPETVGLRIFADYHPNTKMYMDYLKLLGFVISPEVQQYVEKINGELLQQEHRDTLYKWCVGVKESRPKHYFNIHLV